MAEFGKENKVTGVLEAYNSIAIMENKQEILVT